MVESCWLVIIIGITLYVFQRFVGVNVILNVNDLNLCDIIFSKFYFSWVKKLTLKYSFKF